MNPHHLHAQMLPTFSDGSGTRRKYGAQPLDNKTRWSEKGVVRHSHYQNPVACNLPRISGEFHRIFWVPGSTRGQHRYASVVILVEGRDLRFPGDKSEGAASHDVGGSDNGFSDMLRTLNWSAGFDDHFDGRSVSASSPGVSPIIGSGGGAEQNAAQPQATPSSIPLPSPSQGRPVLPRMKKKSGVSRTWNEFKQLSVKMLGGGGTPPPNLSDRLVPERDGGVRWYETLLSRPLEHGRIRR